MAVRVQPSMPRAGLRRRVIRHPLTGLLVLVAVIGLCWALLTPAWQSPDEIWHFAYAQSLGERHAFPDAKRPNPFSSAQGLAVQAVGASRLPFYSAQVRPDWSQADDRRFLAAAAKNPSASDGGGMNTESSNPPLLYLYDDLPLLVSSGANAFNTLYAMRIWNVALLLATAVGGWLLIGELLGRRRLAQLAGGAVCGLIPTETFILTSVNPDALMTPLWTLTLWMGARVINRRATTRDVAVVCALTAAAILTKATSYALVPPVAMAVLAGWLRQPPAQRSAAVRPLVLAGGALVVPVIGWIVAARALGRPVVNTITAAPGTTPSAFNVKQLLSYVWQFYLPRLPFLTMFRAVRGLPLYQLWIREGWGVFGYLDVTLPNWLYGVLAGVTGAVAVAAAAALTRIRGRVSWIQVGYLALAGLSLLVLLHVSDYRSIIAGRGLLLQGRYLLPAVGVAGAAVALIVTRVPMRWRGAACAIVLGGLVLLQFVSLAAVATRYYS